MAGSTAYRLTEPALADSVSRPCYRGVTNLQRVYRLNLDLLDLGQPGLPGRTYRAPAGLEHHLAHVARGQATHLRPPAWYAPGRLAAPGGRAGGRIRVRG
jgi:hypothetical protein